MLIGITNLWAIILLSFILWLSAVYIKKREEEEEKGIIYKILIELIMKSKKFNCSLRNGIIISIVQS